MRRWGICVACKHNTSRCELLTRDQERLFGAIRRRRLCAIHIGAVVLCTQSRVICWTAMRRMQKLLLGTKLDIGLRGIACVLAWFGPGLSETGEKMNKEMTVSGVDMHKVRSLWCASGEQIMHPIWVFLKGGLLDFDCNNTLVEGFELIGGGNWQKNVY